MNDRRGLGAIRVWIAGAWHDIGQAARSLRRNVAASVLAVVTVALGIWLQTAMIAVLNGTVWHPLPFRDAGRLVSLPGPISAPALSDWTSSTRSFAGIAGYRTRRYTLTGVGEAASLKATVASGSLCAVLGEHAARGRALSAADDGPGVRSAVLADTAWRAVFGADAAVIGRTIYLNRVAFTIVGVMPPGFQFPTNTDQIDLYTTVAADRELDPRQAETGRPRDLQVVARLADGIDLARAQAEINVVSVSTAKARSEQTPARPGLVVPLAIEISGPVVARMNVLAWAVACVVSVACATVAILFLIRVTNRHDELATRLALGATRGQLARQLLAESLLVAVAGGGVGVLLAFATAKPLLLAAGPGIAAIARARVDVEVIALSVVTCVSLAAAFGAVPAIQAAATEWPRSLFAAGRSRSRPVASAMRGLLVTMEVALALALMVACVTLLQGYVTLARNDPGFDPTDVLTYRIDLSDAMYARPQQAEFFERVRSEVGGLRGVKSAAYTALPPFGDLHFTIRLDGASGRTDNARPSGAEVHLVSPGYFRTLRIPVLEGRDFTPADGEHRVPVVILSRSLALRLFPGEDPIGRSVDVRIGPEMATGPLPVVLGVVGDVRNGSLAATGDPQLYLPYSQAPMIASTTFTARLTDRDPGPVLAAIRKRVGALDGSVPIVSVKPLTDYLQASLLGPRFTVMVVSLFAAAAVFLAMAGLYAVVSYSALARRREFAIRRALGATDRGIARLVIGFGARMVVPGLALGLVGAFAATRLLESVLYGIHPSTLTTMAIATAATVAVAALALWAPARTAGRDDLRVVLQEQA